MQLRGDTRKHGNSGMRMWTGYMTFESSRVSAGWSLGFLTPAQNDTQRCCLFRKDPQKRRVPFSQDLNIVGPEV